MRRHSQIIGRCGFLSALRPVVFAPLAPRAARLFSCIRFTYYCTYAAAQIRASDEAFRIARRPSPLSPYQSRPGPNQRALAIYRRGRASSGIFLQAQFEVVRILQIDVPLSAKRQFQLFCSEHFPGLRPISSTASRAISFGLSCHARPARR